MKKMVIGKMVRLTILSLFCLSVFFLLHSSAILAAGRDSVRIGLVEYGSYCFKDKNGAFYGFDPEYAEMIADYAHLDASFASFTSAMDAMVALDNDKVDMLIGFRRKGREKYLFSDYALNMTNSAIYVRNDAPYVFGDVGQLRAMKFGLLKGIITTTGRAGGLNF